jgi:hypothetical protein
MATGGMQMSNSAGATNQDSALFSLGQQNIK